MKKWLAGLVHRVPDLDPDAWHRTREVQHGSSCWGLTSPQAKAPQSKEEQPENGADHE
ncbi:hypothetical protein MasN3_01210 [Massilia varians]|uniref:Uncharacterized protein n=1 Tax=Massilia varians TaxID=457921 RepID=A0ABN6T3J9_9BURK|nr:hypothetical protein MasN3_01210 [Massilia varians]